MRSFPKKITQLFLYFSESYASGKKLTSLYNRILFLKMRLYLRAKKGIIDGHITFFTKVLVQIKV